MCEEAGGEFSAQPTAVPSPPFQPMRARLISTACKLFPRSFLLHRGVLSLKLEAVSNDKVCVFFTWCHLIAPILVVDHTVIGMMVRPIALVLQIYTRNYSTKQGEIT